MIEDLIDKYKLEAVWTRIPIALPNIPLMLTSQSQGRSRSHQGSLKSEKINQSRRPNIRERC